MKFYNYEVSQETIDYIKQAVEELGGVRHASDFIGITPRYLRRIMNGHCHMPLARALKLQYLTNNRYDFKKLLCQQHREYLENHYSPTNYYR